MQKQVLQYSLSIEEPIMSDKLQTLLNNLKQFAKKQYDIKAMALVGSYASGQQRVDSDVDIMILAVDPRLYLQDESWLEEFGTVNDIERERYGMVTSLRVWYLSGLEVEFSFSTPTWAKLPADPATVRVVQNGMQILHDPKGILMQLIGTVKLTGVLDKK
jgi:predicted nucleotidyltransferase